MDFRSPWSKEDKPSDTPQDAVWNVEKMVISLDKVQKEILEEQRAMNAKLEILDSHVEGGQELFRLVREGQEEEVMYRTKTQEQLVDEVNKLRRLLHEKESRIIAIRAGRKTFWTRNKSAALCFALALLSAFVCAWLNLNYEGLYASFALYFALFMAVSGTLFVAGSAFKKEE